MKKFNSNLSAKLVIISLASVMALTACERRERPLKAKAAQTENGVGEAKNAPVGDGAETDGATQENSGAKASADAYAEALAALSAEKASLAEKGYVIDLDAKAIDISVPHQAVEDQEEGTSDKADQAVGCELKRVLELHEAFLKNHAYTNPGSSVSHEVYLANIESAEDMIESIKNTLNLDSRLEKADCETASVAPAPAEIVE